MKLGIYNEEDHYALYEQWSSAQGAHALPASHLPPMGFIVIPDRGGAPLAVGWADLSVDIGTYRIVYLTADPSVGGILKAKAVKWLIEGICDACLANDYQLASVYTANKGLIEILSQIGWTKADENLTLMMKGHS